MTGARDVEDIARCSVSRVRAINQHSDPVHLPNELDSKAAQAAVTTLMTSIPDVVLLVVSHQSLASKLTGHLLPTHRLFAPVA